MAPISTLSRALFRLRYTKYVILSWVTHDVVSSYPENVVVGLPPLISGDVDAKHIPFRDLRQNRIFLDSC